MNHRQRRRVNSRPLKRRCLKRNSTNDIIPENSIEQENFTATTVPRRLHFSTQISSANAPSEVAVDSKMILVSDNDDIETNEQSLRGDSQNAAGTLSEVAVLYKNSDNPWPENNKDSKYYRDMDGFTAAFYAHTCEA